MKNQLKRILAVALVATAAPASAIPVQFDFAGVVRSVIDYDFATGEQINGQGPVGSAFSAQFLFDTDLFGPPVPEEAEFSDRLTFAAQLPGAVSANLVIGGVSVDIFEHDSDSASLNFNDSWGVSPCGEGCSAVQPDQWGLTFQSETVTDIGRTALRSGFFTFAAEVDFTRPELAMNWLDFSEGIDPADIATLPILTRDPVSLYILDYNYVCAERCTRTGVHMTLLEMSSVARTVASVPEPGTLGLFALGLAGMTFATRRRRART